MGTSTKTRLTWSLAVIATSVSSVVSTHQAQAKDGSQGLRQIALITGPNIPPRGLWAFDISFVDDQSQVYYLADASNASVDRIDTRTDERVPDEVWHNRGDRRFYLAAFTDPTGQILSVVDAVTGTWVENVASAKNALSVAVDPLTNHIFAPESGRGIVVYAEV